MYSHPFFTFKIKTQYLKFYLKELFLLLVNIGAAEEGEFSHRHKLITIYNLTVIPAIILKRLLLYPTISKYC